MTGSKSKVIKDSKGREVVRFTTPSGVEAVVATSISPEALDKFAKSLAQKIAATHKKNGEDGAAETEPQSAWPLQSAMHSPLPEHMERAPSVARLVRLVEKIVAESGNPDNFDAAGWTERWLGQPNAALGGRLPSEFMQTEDGRQVVESIVARMQSGAYC